MNPIVDMVGFRWGKLTVVERAGSGPGKVGALWRCKCDCGNECIKRGVVLRLKKTVSCGCYRKVWSPELKTVLVELCESGIPTKQIAEKFGKSPETIRKARLSVLGLDPRWQQKLWTPEEDEKLLGMIRADMSAGLIADILGRTRNMIVGRANRIGVKFGKPKHTRTPRPRSRARRSERLIVQFIRKRSPLDELNANIPTEQRKTLLELRENSCRWPIGDAGEPNFFFCGAEKSGRFPYCEAHCGHAYALGKRELAA